MEEFDLLEKFVEYGNSMGEDYGEDIDGWITADWDDDVLVVTYETATEDDENVKVTKRYKFTEVQ